MKIVVSGSRDWENLETIRIAFSKYITEDPSNVLLIHGGARGLDILAQRVGRENGYKIIEFPAEWKKYGLSAGPIRNRQMLDQKPDLVIWFHQDLSQSKGTKDLVNEAKRRGIKIVCGS